MEETLNEQIEGFLLSPQQRRARQLGAAGGPPLRTVFRIRLDGAVDRRRLEDAVNGLALRNQILRTAFRFVPGFVDPLQVIEEDLAPAFASEDLSGLDGPAREERREELWQEERRRPVEEGGPPLSCRLLALGPEHHELLCSVPSAMADAASARLLVAELAALLAAPAGEAAAAEEEAEEEEGLQYVQVADWLNEMLEVEDGEVARAFWRKADLPGLAADTLPDQSPARSNRPPAVLKVRPDVQVLERLAEVAEARETVLPVVLLAAWQGVLRRLGGEGAVALVSDGRKYEEMEALVGPFSRLLPLPVLQESDSFSALVDAAATAATEAEEYQEGLRPPVDQERRPLTFPFGFEMRELGEPAEADGLRLTLEAVSAMPDRFVALLSVVAGEEGWHLELSHDEEALPAAAAERLADAYSHLLASAAADPEAPLAALEILGDEARRELRRLGTGAEAARRPASVHRLFEEQAAETPEAVALAAGGESLTYAELDRRAEALARHLRDLGAGQEKVVGLLAEPSPGLVVGILATLKAGAAYLPLDPALPQDRLAYMLEDAGACLLLTQQALLEALPEASPETVLLEAEPPEAGGSGTLPEAAPESLAYVIYTSGSTGKPKGTMVPHSGVVNYLLWAKEAYRPEEGRGVPFHSSIAFDISVTSLFLPLVSGRTVELLASSAHVGSLAAALKGEGGYSFVKLTPSHLRVLAQQLSKEERSGRAKAMILGGEPLSPQDLEPWRQADSELRFFNEYGPTETVVGCTIYEARGGEPAGGSVPIGRAIANTDVYVTDEELRLLPAGVEGELVVGGSGVTRGYLARPALTARLFVPHPFSEEPGARLYRTGDRVRWRADGELDFLGRADDQVKVRGHRVELGEVESCLRGHVALEEVAVVARKDDLGGDRLVAYLLPVEGEDGARTAPTVTELRSYLEASLPEYMVPAAFVVLEDMPRTASGKVDRRSLPEPDEALAAAGGAYTAPRTVEEEILASIWSQVLDVDRVGIDDDFFALGGDSIRSIQVVSLAQEKGLDVALDQVFNRRTVRKLAADVLEQKIAAAEPSAVEPFSLISEEDRRRVPAGVLDVFPLSQLQGGMIFHHEASPGEGIYHDVFSFHVRGKSPLDVDALRTAVDQLVQRHPALRTTFDVTRFSRPLQVVWKEGASPLGVSDLRDLSPEEQDEALDRWMKDEVRRGFKIDELPLIRYQVHLRDEKSFQFTVSFHHAIIDGWSDASMLTELAVSYQSLVRGEGIPFEAPATRHADFVALELEALASEETRAFWWQRLADLPPVSIPRHQEPAEGKNRGTSWQAVPIPEELSDGLKAVARKAAVPIKNVLLAAHLRVLAFLRGSTDTWTCVTANGRPETADGERVLGLFLNSLPVRLKLAGGTWLDLVQRVFDAERDALVHRRFPMPEMQRWVDGSRLRETSFYFTHYHVYHAMERFTEFEAPLSIDFHEVTSFPIVTSFRVDPFTSHIRMNLTCDGDLFSDAQTKAFGGFYLRVLEAMASDPEGRYDALSILGEEREGVLRLAAGGEQEVPEALPVLERFAEVAESHGGEVALRCGQVSWTFDELHRRSGRVAARLRAQGLGRGSLVGILLDRTPEAVAVLLGVLKAGGAYLPLDPEYPPLRLAHLVEDSGAAAIVTTGDLEERLPESTAGAKVLRAGELLEGDDGVFVRDRETHPEDPAYVIYTSGSTGRPKGVLVSHGALGGYLAWAVEAYGREGRGALVHSSLSFDLTMTSLFVPLLTGKTAVLVPETEGLEGLADALKANPGLSFVKLTPGHARMLAAQLSSEEIAASAPAALVLGGEALRGEDLSPWRSAAGKTVIHNEYGPTEAVVGCTLGPRPAEELADGPVNLGRPAPGTRLYVVDDFLQPLPVTTTGQLLIGGRSLAQGYLGRPRLTAERFLPDPFSSEPGARAYWTGDLVRYRQDGELEFFGRSDEQVKIRGYRIELGEIEAVLAEHPGVRQVVAVVGGGSSAEARLVAYAVADGGSLPPVEELRSFLAERLPDHMVPALFVALDEVPLSPHGKVDRAALPDPEETHARMAAPYAPPITQGQEILAGVWSRVLEQDRVGIDDDYFALGGDSIRSVQVVALAREKGLEIPLDSLFQHRTIRELAASLRQGGEEVEEAAREPFAGLTEEDRRALPEDAVDAYPMSQLQAGMIYHRERQPESAVYFNRGSFHLKAPLDLEVLEKAVSRLVARHETLRTTFHLSDLSAPMQVVHETAPSPLVVAEDLYGLSAGEQEEALEAWKTEERQRVFDHEELPLVRFTVHRRSEETFQFSQSFHHAILDGWSNATLLSELFQDYFALLDGEEKELTQPETRVKDFVALERKAMDDPAAREHWTAVASESPYLEIPRGRTEAVPAEERVGIRHVAIPEDVAKGLGRLVRATAVPMKSVLLGAHLRVLATLAGQPDVLTLVTSTGRPETSDGEKVLGLFLNSIPVRLQLEGGTWQELGEEAFEAESRGLAHRRYPLAEMQKIWGGPLSETAFYFTHFHVYQSLGAFPGLEVLDYDLKEETNYTLLASFGLEPFTGDLHCHIACDRTVLSDEQIEAIGGYYERVLAAMAVSPSGRYDGLEVLSEEERRQALLGSASSPEGASTVVELFLEAARKHPDAVALRQGDESWTFRQLEERSAALAAALARRGVGAETTVGLYLERSPESVDAVLAILRAGGAFVPLDPAYPAKRLEYVVGESRPAVILTNEALATSAPAGAEVLTVEELASEKGASEKGASEKGASEDLPPVSAEQLAYVLYTSGSTGRPKGVMVPHGGLANYLRWAREAYAGSSAGSNGGSLVHSSLSFDLTVTGIFVPLLTGETVVLVPPGEGVEGLGEALLQERDLSFLKLTPSHLRLLDQQLEPAQLAGRTRALILGGEALEAQDLAPWREGAPETLVLNEYGPTETVVGCTVLTVKAGDLKEGAVDVGRPMAGARIVLADTFLRPVPLGVGGEVLVGGPGVSRGYLGQPALTAERFVPDPFSGEAGARLYRTGDLARIPPQDPEGALQFLGRRDRQVKIRGHRVELGEIRACLEEHPQVAQGEVLVLEDRIVAFFVPESGGTPRGQELLGHLGARLPEVFLPAAVVPLPEIPLTPNGKVDRKALEALDPGRLGAEASYEAPRNRDEEILCAIWSQALGVEQVGIDDDYFVLGGDSIRSLQVVALARKKGIELSLDSLFRFRTVRQLAEALGETRILSAGAPRTAPFSLVSEKDRTLLPEGTADAYPLTRLQAGMLYHREVMPDSAIYHDIIRFRLRAPFDEELLRQAAAGVAERHPALRTTFHLSGFSEPLQLVHEEGGIEVRVVDLRDLSEEEQETSLEAWVEAEKRRGFDPRSLPLMRYAVHRLSDDIFQFGLSFHHAIIDGWSDATMLTEVALSYLALRQGLPIPITPPKSLYRDFVALEQEALESAEAREYWLGLLEGASFLEVPRWPVAEGEASAGVHTIVCPVTDEIFQGVQRLAREAAVPVKSVLLASHMKVMGLVAGTDDVLTTLSSSGRLEAEDGDRVFGLFLNSLPYRLRLPGGTWKELVQQAFQEEEDALPHRRFPMAEMQRLRGGHPLAETGFYFTHYHIFRNLERFADLEVLRYDAYEETNFAMGVNFGVNRDSTGLRMVVSGAAGSFPRSQLERVGTYYLRVLEAMGGDPAGRYEELQVLSPAERQQLLVDWNETGTAAAEPATIQDLIAVQIRRAPEALAVSAPGRTLSYGELDEQAETLARALVASGVGRGSFVGVCLERSPELVVAFLAVLRAGAAYVPLDPQYPEERLTFMLDDAGVEMLVSETRFLPELPTYQGKVLCLDEQWAPAPDTLSEVSLPETTPEDLAYVIFTSGSTGRPKGVLLPHRAFASVSRSQVEMLQVGPESRVVQFSSISFDASIFDFVLALTHGGSLCMPPGDLLVLGEPLAEFFRDEKITVSNFAPSVLASMPAWELPDLETVLVVGEECPPELVNQWAPGRRFLNGYGPTENTIWATMGICRVEDEKSTIGRPNAHTRLYLTDPRFRLVPAGTPGEVLLSGDGLAWGYLNRPRLTAERFLPDPFSRDEGARVYRTGDLARHRPEGDLEFVGRVDNQVQLRGFRVELGEIEARLLDLPGVAQAAVDLRQDQPGDQRLVAYVVPETGAAPAASELAQGLAEVLPRYMVPSAFVELQSLPLSPNGKLDRQRLPAPGEGDMSQRAPFAAPTSETEKGLAALWEEVLGVEQVGLDDDFFQLGGHSILATRLVSRVRETFDVALPLRQLFDATTVRALAGVLDQEGRGEGPGAKEAIPTADAALADAQDLSDDDLDALLHTMMSEEDAVDG